VTAAVAGRAVAAGRGAGTARAAAGGATQAEKDTLARKVAAAQAAQQPPQKPVETQPQPAAPSPPKNKPAAPQASGGRFRAGLARAGTPVQAGAGVILGLFGWCWVAMPFIQGGPTRVRDVWRAKFLNKGPDGKWLP